MFACAAMSKRRPGGRPSGPAAGLAILTAIRAVQPRKEGDQQTVSFAVTPQNLAAASYPIASVAEYQGHQYTQGYETVGYPGLRPYNYYQPPPTN